MNAGTYCGLVMAGVFVILEMGILLIACIGQFKKGFEAHDAMGAFISAFAFGAVATMFSFVAMVTCRFKNRWVNLVPVAIWGGFMIMILVGAALHEMFIVHR